MSEFADVLIKGCKELGMTPPPEAAGIYEKYRLFLAEKNRLMNLTAVEGERELAERHFLDSLALLLFADFRGAKVIDVGTGAGFPGLPLKIAEPSLELTLLDSQRKKTEFLSELCLHLGVEAACLQGGAVELALLPSFGVAFDVCVARSVARLYILAELCLPLVRPGGFLLAMKARDCGEELAEAESSIALLGGGVESVCGYAVGSVPRSVVKIRKISATPPAYPRRFSKIQRRPL